MASGYRFPQEVRREFFDRVCRGQAVTHAARDVGVFRNTAWKWWRDAGAMQLLKGKGEHGLATPGKWSQPGGSGRPTQPRCGPRLDSVLRSTGQCIGWIRLAASLAPEDGVGSAVEVVK